MRLDERSAQPRQRLEVLGALGEGDEGKSRRRKAAALDAAQASLYRTIVPDMLRWLPEAEAAKWREAIETELERLGH
jgi:hypothetical protein